MTEGDDENGKFAVTIRWRGVPTEKRHIISGGMGAIIGALISPACGAMFTALGVF